MPESQPKLHCSEGSSPDKIMDFNVNINKTAKNDLREIVKFISKNNPINALNILKRIEEKINTLNHFPERGGYVPELLKYNVKDYDS